LEKVTGAIKSAAKGRAFSDMGADAAERKNEERNAGQIPQK